MGVMQLVVAESAEEAGALRAKRAGPPSALCRKRARPQYVFSIEDG